MAQGVSEYVRGFSFMPENKVDVIDLQYIEGGELSRAWKISRREKLKNIEAKIWDEFINERDMVDSVSSDDPYQFIEELPDNYIREVLDTELMKMKEETAADSEDGNPTDKSESHTYKDDDQDRRETMVSFDEVIDVEHSELITIVDEDNGSETGEKEELNESMDSPCTVRENQNSPDPTSEVAENNRDKSPENVTNMIEASIYTAKVKELQSKVSLELLGVITTLENHNVHQLDVSSFVKLQKQCTEFCARFGRIYLYPISRQIHDITRHNNSATPFARHTHTRSQLVRSVSLQQNMLQCLQIFHKWFTQKTPLTECVNALKSFINLVREADSVCPVEVHNEEILLTCESVEKALAAYLVNLNKFLGDEKDIKSTPSHSVKNSKSMKKRNFGAFNKQGKIKGEADAKLSMYSLDRLSHCSKSVISRSSGATSKARLADAISANTKNHNPNPFENNNETAAKKTRSRRPLMRAPGGGQRRDAHHRHEQDNITTLVEAVHVMRTPRTSTAQSGRDAPPPPTTPRSPHLQRTPRGARKSNIPLKSPIISPRRAEELEEELKLTLEAANLSEESLPSVITVQCAKKDSPVVKTPLEISPRMDGKSDLRNIKDEKNVSSTSDVSVLLRQLCSGQSNSRLSPKERVTGSKNAQLLSINGDRTRSPSLGTPQLLRILEETIQKQAPKPQFSTKPPVKDLDRYRLSFSRSSAAADALFQYRTKFVQHMLSSPMYANSRVGKPWEMIGKISEEIIDEILLSCAKEMQLEHIVEELYLTETQ